jgi:hypothetical protein
VEKFHDPVGNKIPVFYSAYFIEWVIPVLNIKWHFFKGLVNWSCCTGGKYTNSTSIPSNTTRKISEPNENVGANGEWELYYLQCFTEWCKWMCIDVVTQKSDIKPTQKWIWRQWILFYILFDLHCSLLLSMNFYC